MSERPGRRDQIEWFKRDMVRSGMDPKRAAEKARECAVRKDRREVENVNPNIERKRRAADEARERAERARRDG